MSSLDKQLMTAGLTNMQARMYVALLQLGESTASQLAKESGINRVTAYTTLDELEAFGLVTPNDYDQIRIYRPTALESLEHVFMNRAKQAIQSYRQVQSIIPDLKTIANKRLTAPQTVYVEGVVAARQYLVKIPQTDLLHGMYIAEDAHYEYIKPLAKRAAEGEVRPQAIIPNSVHATLLVYIDHRVVPGKIAQFPVTTLFFAERTVYIFQDGEVVQLFALEDSRIAAENLGAFALNWRILSGHHLIVAAGQDT